MDMQIAYVTYFLYELALGLREFIPEPEWREMWDYCKCVVTLPVFAKTVGSLDDKKRFDRIIKAYGEFLEGISDWTHFLTITVPAGQKRTDRAWRRSMKRISKWDFPDFYIKDMFWALERHKSGHLHCHALAQCKRVFFDDDIEEKEELDKIGTEIFELLFATMGRSLVTTYDPKLGASHYVSKYVVKDIHGWEGADWDIYTNIENPAVVQANANEVKI